jgi:voltage-gated potassium channel
MVFTGLIVAAAVRGVQEAARRAAGVVAHPSKH